MNSFTQLLRMAKWARHPPSRRRVLVVLVAVALCLVLFGIDRMFGWPDWLTPNRVPRGRLLH